MIRTLGGLSALLLVVCCASASTTFTFQTIPAGGNLTGAAGSTVYFGYSITNPDPDLFLLTTNFTADVFQHASVNSLFDFPVIGPGGTVTVPYDPQTGLGLFSVQLDSNAPAGFVNSGAFVVSGDFYSGDPLDGGTFSNSATDQVAGYSVTVGASSVPEPSAIVLMPGALLAMLVGSRLKRRS